jgi:hypothetical protein
MTHTAGVKQKIFREVERAYHHLNRPVPETAFFTVMGRTPSSNVLSAQNGDGTATGQRGSKLFFRFVGRLACERKRAGSVRTMVQKVRDGSVITFLLCSVGFAGSPEVVMARGSKLYRRAQGTGA